MSNETIDVSTLSYEQARDELVDTVRRLEDATVPLEKALEMWERGEALARHCQSFLDAAKARLDAAVQARTANNESVSPTAD